jgi:pSer/pThr/pTyr-binding forkhead associated (FHA) protein
VFDDKTMLDPAAAPGAPADPNATQQMPAGLSPNMTQQLPAGMAPDDPAGGFLLPDATQQAISILCAVCQTPNQPGERWCQDCGFLLGSTLSDAGALPDAASLPRLVAATNGGREYPLNAGENSVGRENADVLLPDSQVSRRHARLFLEGQSLTIEDLGSTNGTKVAGRRLTPGERAPVQDGDEIQFGTLALRALLPGGAAPAPSRPATGNVTQTLTSPGGSATQAISAATLAAALAGERDRGPAVGSLTREDGQEFALFDGTNTLGRRPDNDVCLTGDPYVSGRHAELRIQGGRAELVDTGSTNGTFLHDERLPPGGSRLLVDGTDFHVGKTQLTLRLSPVPAVPGVGATQALDPSALPDFDAPAPGDKTIAS